MKINKLDMTINFLPYIGKTLFMYRNVSTKYEKIRTKRFRLFTGPLCNARCGFCYYICFLQRKTNPSTIFLKKELEWARSMGALDVDFSGGEPTIRSDIIELVSHAKSLGYRKIAVITNGIVTGQTELLTKLADKGLNDILVSIHGHNPQTHDTLVGILGAFEKVLKTLKYAKLIGIRLRTNTTVVTKNAQYLPELAKLLIKFEPYAVNFILFNDWYSPASQMLLMPNFEHISHYLKNAIDSISGCVPKVTVRYIPFCFMEGYERYIANFPQVPYDPDEWAPEIQILSPEFGVFSSHERIPLTLRIKRFVARAMLLKHMRSVIDSYWLKAVQSGFFKPSECKKCSFQLICDGIKKGYEKLYPSFKVYPRNGSIILDPMYFRGPYLMKVEVL
jgi:sulfatase maturation enzyme AslB (radical SAM superfamily)